MGCGSSTNMTKLVPVKETATMNNNLKSKPNENTKRRESLKQVKSTTKVQMQENRFPIAEDVEIIEHTEEKEFPNPEDVEISEYTPIKEDSSLYLKIEDTFWEGKRCLIPDYSVMLKLDQHALKVFSNI